MIIVNVLIMIIMIIMTVSETPSETRKLVLR